MGDEPTKVLVLVDRPYDRKRARTSLWKDFLKKLNYTDVDEVSIWEKKVAEQSVRPDEANVLIVNWDSANGDYICGSDVALAYFQTHGHRRDALMQRNGKLICEFQSGMGVLKQVTYDAIFGPGEVEVVDIIYPPSLPRQERDDLSEDEIAQLKQAERSWIGKSVTFFKKYKKNHPILASLDDKLASLYESKDPLYHFENGAQQEKFCWYRHAPDGAIYHGWFCNWKKDWVPLLVAEPAERWKWRKRWFTPPPAVLLAKSYKGGGFMVASTMWMAVPGLETLAESILNVDTTSIYDAHRKYKRWRLAGDLAVLALLIAFPLAPMLLVLKLHSSPGFMTTDVAINSGLPRSLWHSASVLFLWALGEIGGVWLIVIFGRFWKEMIRNRPLGVGFLQFFASGRKGFCDKL